MARGDAKEKCVAYVCVGLHIRALCLISVALQDIKCKNMQEGILCLWYN